MRALATALLLTTLVATTAPLRDARARADVFERVGLVRGEQFDDRFASARDAALAHADLAGMRDASALWSQPGALPPSGMRTELVLAIAPDYEPLRDVDPVTLAPKLQHNARRTNRLARLQPEMRQLLTSPDAQTG